MLRQELSEVPMRVGVQLRLIGIRKHSRSLSWNLRLRKRNRLVNVRVVVPAYLTKSIRYAGCHVPVRRKPHVTTYEPNLNP